MKRVLITGACGVVATMILDDLAKKYELVLCDKSTCAINYPVHVFDLVDYAAILGLCKNVDCVIHLAADPSPQAQWDSLLTNNIIATQNLFRAAAEAGCRRVIYASSVETMFGYGKQNKLPIERMTLPNNLYGASKVFGEALASVYAHQQKLSIICLRLGWVLHSSSDMISLNNKALGIILTQDDLKQLIETAIETPCHFGIFYGLSNNRHNHFDMRESRNCLGYKPKDDAFKIARKKHGLVKQFISWVKD